MSDDNIDGLGTRRGEEIEDFRPFFVAAMVFLAIALTFGALCSCIAR